MSWFFTPLIMYISIFSSLPLFPLSGSCKGFAFIQVCYSEQARKVLADLKDGAEVKGKRVGISLSQETDTLYMGNICKTWTREQVLERLKNLGVEQIEEIYLPEEISTHSDAMSAFQRLQKPDAFFGRDRSAQVAFSQSIHPSGAAALQRNRIREEGTSSKRIGTSLKSLKEFQNLDPGILISLLHRKSCVTSSELWSKYTKNVYANPRAREVEWDLQMEELTGDLNQCRLELNYKDQQIEKLQMELEGYRSTIMHLKQ
ncbi:hypothetical protein Syun_006124 [Stephania yunnanensis]|uniref:RRM domain-containing protein n=1 Tax=Stephania yunnanensis TaxID=152371 RepID=A0AAP0KXG3_9MAGN